MIDRIYVEDGIGAHPRTAAIQNALPHAKRIACNRYGEIFNRRRQSFRLQKQNPALILAEKKERRVLPTPPDYGIGGARNFYFSHMLNCIYDCRYCFLQGMLRSAHFVLFVNYEDFALDLDNTLSLHADEDCYFFSGYDCDSLALEGLSGFARFFLPFFAERPRAVLELRTKSVQIESLLAHPPLPNVVVAWSVSPDPIQRALEHKTPTLERRLAAAKKLQDAGWPIGLRFDPLIYSQDAQEEFAQLLDATSAALDFDRLHSVSLGVFRLPRDFHRRLVRLYPESPMLAAPTEQQNGMVTYREELREALFDGCRDQLLERVAADRYYPCLS